RSHRRPRLQGQSL
ncbi:hypothetical protein AB1N83_001587, partial [Pleurotus pulmonarius]